RRAVEGGVRRHGEGAPGRIGLGPRELLISRSAPRESMGGRFFFFKQKTAYEIGLVIPAEPLFRSIEALKPAIEACGISTLSQSPMLGFHKQMDNRIKLLEEILSFRMQGVEFDNGDMYVDGHKAASD